MKEIIAGSFVGVLLGMLAGTYFGAALITDSHSDACDALGAFRAGGHVYECHRRPAAQGVVQ